MRRQGSSTGILAGVIAERVAVEFGFCLRWIVDHLASEAALSRAVSKSRSGMKISELSSDMAWQ